MPIEFAIVATPFAVAHDAFCIMGGRFQCKMHHMVRNVLLGAQIRAGRALLRWSAERLAEEARVGRITVSRAERVDGATKLTAANIEALRGALEANGVEFIEENGGGAGVRLKRPISGSDD